jgi:hypothetical protein
MISGSSVKPPDPAGGGCQWIESAKEIFSAHFVGVGVNI